MVMMHAPPRSAPRALSAPSREPDVHDVRIDAASMFRVG